jgi:predicted HAD superfamily Cof-like phosphohydrolase
MDSMLEKVRKFHEHFGVPVAEAPQVLDAEASEFRIKFLREEVEEYVTAVEVGDITGQFDSLLDLLYVTYGTLLWHGFPTEEGFDLVHLANMAKVRVDHADNSTRSSRFDVVKPAGWKSPNDALNRLIMYRMFNRLAPSRDAKIEEARKRLVSWAQDHDTYWATTVDEIANDILTVLG